MGPVDPQILLAIAGLFTSAAAYLAGRSRALSNTITSITLAYEAIITQLRVEVDRLHVQVSELQAALRDSTPRRRSSPKVVQISGL